MVGLQGALVHTLWVSPFTGLLASLCTLLVPVNSLTSHFDREEGVCMAIVGHGLSHGGTHVTSSLDPKE
jgi:hypothetical protein